MFQSCISQKGVQVRHMLSLSTNLKSRMGSHLNIRHLNDILKCQAQGHSYFKRTKCYYWPLIRIKSYTAIPSESLYLTSNGTRDRTCSRSLISALIPEKGIELRHTLLLTGNKEVSYIQRVKSTIRFLDLTRPRSLKAKPVNIWSHSISVRSIAHDFWAIWHHDWIWPWALGQGDLEMWNARLFSDISCM